MGAEEPIPTDAELWRQAERLRALARTLIADPNLGEDLVQDACVAALRRPSAVRHGLGAWLAGALRHLARRARTREAARAGVERRAARAEALEGPDEAVARAELQQRLGAAVLALGEPYRSAVILRHLEQLEPDEIARRQGCSREAARQRVARGLEELRRRLDAEHGGRERWCVLFAPLARPPAFPSLPPTLTVLGGALMSTKWILAPAALALVVGLAWLVRDRRHDALDGADADGHLQAELAVLPDAPGEPAESASPSGERTEVPASPASLPPTPAESEGALLTGRVVEPDGAPVAEARVSLRTRELRGFSVLDLEVARTARVIDEARTGVDGRFAFALDPMLAVDVWAEKDGSCEAVTIDRHAGQVLELVLTPGFLVRGRVTRAADGRAVAEAEVRAMQLGERSWAHRRDARTDADGRYELRLPVRERVTVDVLPRVEQARDNLLVEFDSSGVAHLDVEVVEGLEVTGRVTDAATGLPLADATIGEGWFFRRTAVSDANGEYRLTGFGELGVHELYARASGYGKAVDSPAIVDARHRRLDFALRPSRAATGRLVDTAGQPVPGAYIAAVGQGSPSEVDWASAWSDADGRFRCVDLTPSLRHALIVHHSGFATVVYDFPFEERTTSELDLGTLVLRPPGLIAGRVLDTEGRGIAGATVELAGTNRDRRSLVGAAPEREREIAKFYVSEREAFTDEEGRFWFGGTPAGDFTLTARATGRAPLAATPFTLGAGERRSDVRLVFPVGGTLRGRVVDESAVGLGGVHVRAEPEPAPRGLRYEIATRTAPDGTFELRDLPAARYTLEVFPFFPGDVPGSDPLAPWLYSCREHVSPDAELVVLTVRRGVCIEGTLLDAAGDPLHGHQISLVNTAGEAGLGTTTDSEGRFRLAVEPGQTWTIEVSGPSERFDWGTLLVRPGIPSETRDLELRLPR